MSTQDFGQSTNPETDYLTNEERIQLRRLLSQPEEFPREFGSWIKEYISLNGEIQPFQVQGLSLRAPRTATVVTAENLGFTTSYSDLATVGPKLEDLGKGTYLVFYSSSAIANEFGAEPWMSVSINGATAVDLDSVHFHLSGSTGELPLFRSLIVDLPLGNNTLLCKYKRIGNGTTVATFSNRQLSALKVANL